MKLEDGILLAALGLVGLIAYEIIKPKASTAPQLPGPSTGPTAGAPPTPTLTPVFSPDFGVTDPSTW
jgi:hypothetical protein